MAHTPGPWHAGAWDWLVSQATGMGYRNFPIRGGEGFDIATVYCDEDDAEQAANVRLIAAAPEMLTALKLGMEWAENDGYDDEHCLVSPAERAFRQAARAAISKAEGSET